MEGNLRFKIDWASLIVGSKFTIFALFYFVFEDNFPSTGPWGAYIWRGDLTEGFFALLDWGAYIWRSLYMEGLFLEFYRIVFYKLRLNYGLFRQLSLEHWTVKFMTVKINSNKIWLVSSYNLSFLYSK